MKKLTLSLLLWFSACAIINAQDMILEPNIFMQIESGTNLKMGAGDLIIESDATGDATLIDLGSISYSSGTANVERYLSNVKWHLISSPVSSAVSGMFLYDYLQYHSESTNYYSQIITNDIDLNIMQGYAYYARGVGFSTVNFVGTTNTGNQEFNFTKTDFDDDNNEGWNLVGNPYPSVLDWNAVTIPANLGGAIWVFDPDLGDDGTYRYYINGGGAGNTTTQYIPSSQGFFVRASGNGTLQFTNAARTYNESTIFYKDADAELEENTMLVLKATSGDITNQTAIGFNPLATQEADRLYDVYSLPSSSEDVPNIYSYCEGQKMAINTYPQIEGNEVVPFFIEMGQSGAINISAHEMSSIPANIPIYLEDVAAQKYQNLRLQPTYNFSYEENQSKDFKIHFKEVTGIEDMLNQNIQAYFNHDLLMIDITDAAPNSGAYHISLYSTSGQQLIYKESSEKQVQIPVNISPGVYLLKIEGSDHIYTQKLIKQ